MQPVEPEKKILGVLIVLAITQVIGWGTVILPAIICRQIAADLGMDVPAVFAGSSTLYLVMGLCAPVLARAFIRFGARRVMMIGAITAAAGFVVLAASRGSGLYFVSWRSSGSRAAQL